MSKHVVVGTLNEGETYPPKKKKKAPAKRKRKAPKKK